MANETKVVITAQTAQAEAAFKSLGGSVDGISKKIFQLQGVAATLGVTLSIGAFVGMVKSAIDLGDQLNKLSQKTGTSVEALAGLKFAADQNGTSLESVANAAKKLSVNMAENPDVFKKFGITAKDSTGALIQLADIFRAMPDGVEKTALAVKLMGKNGEEMIPFLNQGGTALKEMVEQGKKLYPITAANAKAAEEFNDKLSLIKAQSSTIGISIANELLKPLNRLATEFLTARDNGLSFAESLKEIGLRSPGNSIRENIKNIDNEIAALEKWLVVNNRATDSVKESQKANIESKKKAREYFLELERNAALEGSKSTTGYRLEGGNAQPNTNIGKGKKLLNALGGGPKDKTFDPEGDFWFAVEEAREKNRKKSQENPGNTGIQVLIGLEKDYQNELAKRKDALAAPLLSERERNLADDMRNMGKRAQDSRVELEKLHISGTLSLENYQNRLEEVNKQEANQKKSVAEMAAEQDKLNSSWEYGADVALRKYMDEAEKVASNTAAMLSSAYDGITSGIASSISQAIVYGKNLEDSLTSVALNVSDAFIAAFIKIQIQKLFIDKTAAAGYASTLSLQAQAMAQMAALNTFASVSAIPIVGPAAAGPASVAAFSYAEGLAGLAAAAATASIASARGGFDIPAGSNPITQLHEKEMVLPARQADVIRNLAKGNNESSAITIINQTSVPIGKVTEQRLSNGERAIIIQEAVAATAAQLGDPNSKTSRSMNRNFNLQRAR